VAQFEVYANPNLASRGSVPFLISLQSDSIPGGATTIVAPLARKSDPGAASQLQRAVVVNGEPLVLLFQAIAAVRTKDLGRPIAALPEVRDYMMSALDLLFLGF
jgi:hypothetical protein